ncbi:protein kinase [Nonomuraea sp. NBC_01738]|uniref:serine/threonine-protein kinase n=1 Tax=Nonomuraea sp. NBC_01738 TaxID=2976003 RepID=UPI002E115534|nr:protein kinase [Nonomuraea sp. NBC_01738]
MRVIAGRYTLHAPLGSGGAGTVWRARDELLHREVAVKEVRLPQDGDRQRALVDTLREARAAAALNHPSIITVHDVLDEGGQPWIIMDLLAGRSLGDLVKESGPMPLGQVATVGLRMVEALGVAHGRGMLHRDVKPGNVMITDDGEAVLTDFGIAAHLGDAPGQATAAAAAHFGAVQGSPGYIAPERLRGEAAGPQSDLWSLAATLYTALEGVGPFERGSSMAVVAAVLTMPAPPPANAGPLTGLLMAMLGKEPGRRPHPQQVHEALAPYATPLPARSRPVVTAPATLPMRTRRSRLPLVIGGTAAGTAAAVVGVLALMGGFGTSGGTGARGAGPATTAASSPVASQAPTASTRPSVSGQPKPVARGDGRFARSPAACDLITDEQAATILPGSHSKQQDKVRDGECYWARGAVGITEDLSVTVKVLYFETEKAATSAYAIRLKTQKGETGAGEDGATSAPEILSLGDASFVQDTWQTAFMATTNTDVWIRMSNVIVQVSGKEPKKERQIERTHPLAMDAARAVAGNLRKAT